MMSGQLLVDFLQAVETEVMQGSRDYPHDISDIEGLLRWTFTSGLPGWLCRQLTLLDFLITSRMVEKSQVAWDATVLTSCQQFLSYFDTLLSVVSWTARTPMALGLPPAAGHDRCYPCAEIS